MANGNDPGRLTWNVPITNPDGTPTNEFMRKWQAQATVNAAIPDLADAAAVSTVLDFIGSASGDILARGASMWKTLAAGTDGKVLRTKGAALPEWDTVAALLDQVASTQGDILYRNATGWVALAPGTAGFVLESGGAAANPSWVAPGGGSARCGFIGQPITVAGSFTIADDAVNNILVLLRFGGGTPTITMPAAPWNGQQVMVMVDEFQTYNPTIIGNSGQTVRSPPLSSWTAGQDEYWLAIWDATDAIWRTPGVKAPN